jgi:SAM-dependent methyltransferase
MTAEPISASANPDRPPGEVFCNLCQKAVLGVPMYRVAGCEVVHCPRCDLVFVPPDSVSPQALTALYSKEYFEGGMPDGYADYNASEEILRRQARRTLRLLRQYQPSGALLEIGCAYGFFLLESKEAYQSRGIEISAFAAHEAQKRQLDVVCGDFLEVSLPASHFDVVCLFDCVEHLADPFRYLQQAQQVLKTGGIVALTTGDIGSIYARLARSRWRLMTPPQHLFFFSRLTLTRMLREAGFEVLEVSYPWKLVPWRLVLYQLSPRFKRLLGPLSQLPVGIYVNLFDAMLVIARKK